MPKRKGYIYQRMMSWEAVKEACMRGVTKMHTVFIENGLRHYDMDMSRTFALEIKHRAVDERGCYVDTGEIVKL